MKIFSLENIIRITEELDRLYAEREKLEEGTKEYYELNAKINKMHKVQSMVNEYIED
ncbi:MAG: hypothetical protein ACRCXT_08640 [Paraclostridium sp.]